MDRETVLIKEIDVIQNIIKRMAFNSFLIKGWAVTLITVTLLLKGDAYQNLIALIPLFIFWYLDAYFLWQERAYRELYKWVIENRLKDDKLECDKYLFDMKAGKRFGKKIQTKPRIMFSETLLAFYGSILLLIFIYNGILLISYLIKKGIISL
ncbi:MAG: hypothetical protein GX432_10560 [Candidatus Atribacteria bacterium]|nr:hypothetical protein [Candidatus Atribacteria bacterium]